MSRVGPTNRLGTLNTGNLVRVSTRNTNFRPTPTSERVSGRRPPNLFATHWSVIVPELSQRATSGDGSPSSPECSATLSTSPNYCRSRAAFGWLAWIWPGSNRSCTDVDQFWPDPARKQPRLSWIRTRFDQFWPTLERCRSPMSASGRLPPDLARSSPKLPCDRPTCGDFGRWCLDSTSFGAIS